MIGVLTSFFVWAGIPFLTALIFAWIVFFKLNAEKIACFGAIVVFFIVFFLTKMILS